ncbi:MAG: NB-ARC domain-containing protein [Pseudomonadales bacterium]
MNIFKEIKDRSIFKVSFAYILLAWLLIQIAGIVLPAFESPEWVMKVILLVLALGFPIAIVLAWAQNLKIDSKKEEAPISMAPPPLRQFTARREELGQLEDIILGSNRAFGVVCSIVGMGGVGKSALATQFATEQRQRFSDGIFWVFLDSVTPMDAARNIATAMEETIVVPRDEAHARVTISKLFSKKQALLILDNADGEGAAECIDYIRPSESTVSILITTRDMHLSQSLNAERLDLNSFNIEEGIALLEHVLDKDERLNGSGDDARRIVEALGGLPLALDIAAQYLELDREISFRDYLDDLNIEDLEVPGKSVVATLSKSLNLLSPAEKTAFIALGACDETGFSIETAMAVSGNTDRKQLQSSLIKLCRLSIVQKRAKHRFALHPIVRNYVRLQEGINEADRRHAKHWCSYVEGYNQDTVQDWSAIEVEWQGVRMAWDWCLGQYRDGLDVRNIHLDNCCLWSAKIAKNLRYYLDGCGRWQDSIKRMPETLEAAIKIENIELEFEIRRHLAIILRKTGKFENIEKAAELNLANIKLATCENREDWIGKEKEQLGRVRVRQKLYEEANRLYEDSLRIAQSQGAKRYEQQALNCLGELHRRQSRFHFGRATEYFSKALAHYQQSGDGQGVCSSLGHLADTYSDKGDLVNAVKLYAQAISVFDQSSKVEVEGSLHQNFGIALKRTQRNMDALACFIVAANICDVLGIGGWYGESPVSMHQSLLNALGSDADEFRVTKDRSSEEVIRIARSRVTSVVQSIRNGAGNLILGVNEEN